MRVSRKKERRKEMREEGGGEVRKDFVLARERTSRHYGQ